MEICDSPLAGDDRVDGDELRLDDRLEVGDLPVELVVVVDQSMPVVLDADVVLHAEGDRRPGMRIGLIPFGWTDGFPRRMPETATVLVRGRRASLLGPPHSELMRVDLTDVPQAQLGDDVVFLGRCGDDEISLEELSSQWELQIPDLYCAIGKSVRRSYLA